MTGERTLIQQAADRCLSLIPDDRIWVVTNSTLAPETSRQLLNVPSSQILVEPCGRNTAPCIGLAAIQLAAVDPEAIMLVMPADHVIAPVEVFQKAVVDACAVIEDIPDSLVLFGVPPTYPATGFGYIRRGDIVRNSIFSSKDVAPPTVYSVRSFQEKPDRATAIRYVDSKEFYWNCGIFVWKAQTILNALEQHIPDLYRLLTRLRQSMESASWQKELESVFPLMPSISIDYAVLEKASSVRVMEAPFAWDDVGSWQALPRLLKCDESSNTLDGLVCAVDTSGCIVRTSRDHLVATIGVKDLIIVHTPTATLVADSRDENLMKKLMKALEDKGHHEHL